MLSWFAHFYLAFLSNYEFVKVDPKYFIGLHYCAGVSTAAYWQVLSCHTCRRTEARLRALAHTHRLFAGVGSGSGHGVFTRTGIPAAGGQFDFERCARKMFVHRNRKRNFIQTEVFKTVVQHRQVRTRVQVSVQLH